MTLNICVGPGLTRPGEFPRPCSQPALFPYILSGKVHRVQEVARTDHAANLTRPGEFPCPCSQPALFPYILSGKVHRVQEVARTDHAAKAHYPGKYLPSVAWLSPHIVPVEFPYKLSQCFAAVDLPLFLDAV